MVLLINPPASKPGEPPAGLAKLAGALNRASIPYRVLDAALEGILNLLEKPSITASDDDTWTRRAFRHRLANLNALRSGKTYERPDRCRRAVRDLSRVLDRTGTAASIRLGLADYEDSALLPVRSSDLVRAAEAPERNPFYPYFQVRLLELLEERTPRIIGFSLNYLSQALCTFAMIGLLRRMAPDLMIVLGGGLVTSWSGRLNGANPFRGLVDALIPGPGEAPLLNLLGKSGDCTAACPDYSAFPMKEYLSPGVVLPYAASRGCYWRRCSFCPETAERSIYAPLPVTQVDANLTSLTIAENPALVHFLDNALSPVFLDSMMKRDAAVPWYGFVRITRQLMDKNYCEGLRRSGCVMLKLGLESGSQAVLDRLQKGIDLESASRVLKTLKAAGIATYVYLLFGTPAETPDDARQTLDFVARHSDCIDFLNVAVFNLPAGSAADLETKSFYDADLSLYEDFVHPGGWNRPQVRRFLDREFRRHPAVATILRNDPPVFTSNHAPFLIMASGDVRGETSRPFLHEKR